MRLFTMMSYILAKVSSANKNPNKYEERVSDIERFLQERRNSHQQRQLKKEQAQDPKSIKQ